MGSQAAASKPFVKVTGFLSKQVVAAPRRRAVADGHFLDPATDVTSRPQV